MYELLVEDINGVAAHTLIALNFHASRVIWLALGLIRLNISECRPEFWFPELSKPGLATETAPFHWNRSAIFMNIRLGGDAHEMPSSVFSVPTMLTTVSNHDTKAVILVGTQEVAFSLQNSVWKKSSSFWKSSDTQFVCGFVIWGCWKRITIHNTSHFKPLNQPQSYESRCSWLVINNV